LKVKLLDPPLGYTLLEDGIVHSEVERFHREQGCKESPGNYKELSNGSIRHIYYCQERGCSYALCTITEGGGESAVRLFVKSAHNHRQIRPIVEAARLPDVGDADEVVDGVGGG